MLVPERQEIAGSHQTRPSDATGITGIGRGELHAGAGGGTDDADAQEGIEFERGITDRVHIACTQGTELSLEGGLRMPELTGAPLGCGHPSVQAPAPDQRRGGEDRHERREGQRDEEFYQRAASTPRCGTGHRHRPALLTCSSRTEAKASDEAVQRTSTRLRTSGALPVSATSTRSRGVGQRVVAT